MTALSLDSAVMQFGVWADNKLEERDPTTHQPKYTLKQLLDEGTRSPAQQNRDSFIALSMLFGGRLPRSVN